MSQDPSSLNLGTTVWDASIVLAKYLEKVRADHAKAWVDMHDGLVLLMLLRTPPECTKRRFLTGKREGEKGA